MKWSVWQDLGQGSFEIIWVQPECGSCVMCLPIVHIPICCISRWRRGSNNYPFCTAFNFAAENAYLQADIYQLWRRNWTQQTIHCKILSCTFVSGIALINRETCPWEQTVHRERIGQKPASIENWIFTLEVEFWCHLAIFLFHCRKAGFSQGFQVIPGVRAQRGPVLLHFVGNVTSIVRVNHSFQTIPRSGPNCTIVIQQGENKTLTHSKRYPQMLYVIMKRMSQMIANYLEYLENLGNTIDQDIWR